MLPNTDFCDLRAEVVLAKSALDPSLASLVDPHLFPATQISRQQMIIFSSFCLN